MQRALLYMKHTGKFMSPKYSLFAFQVETNSAGLRPIKKLVLQL